MRPTRLDFRSPNEKTPDFYYPQVTAQGQKLNFKPKSVNRNISVFSKANRFPDKMQINGQTQYLGPGTYDSQKAYEKLT